MIDVVVDIIIVDELMEFSSWVTLRRFSGGGSAAAGLLLLLLLLSSLSFSDRFIM
jgi:hypothetical protein